MKWNPALGLATTVDDAVVLDDEGNPVRPSFIGYAGICLAATVVATVAVPVVNLAYKAELKRILIEDDAKAKVHHLGNAHDVDLAFQRLLRAEVSLGLLLAVTFSVLVYMMFKGKGWPRWVIAASGLITGVPVQVLSIAGSNPLPIRILMTIAGVAFLAALSLLFVVPSRAYFKAHRDKFRAELDAVRVAAARSRSERATKTSVTESTTETSATETSATKTSLTKTSDSAMSDADSDGDKSSSDQAAKPEVN